MKKFLLFSAAALLSATVWAQDNAAIRQISISDAGTPLKTRTATKKAPARIPGVDGILQTPAGKLVDNMTLSAFALYPRNFEIYQRPVSGKVSAIVEGDDGCLYVKNPIAVYDTDCWLKLDHKEGSTYVARLPQTATEAWDYEGETIRLNFDRLDLDEDEGYYYPSFGESELTFRYENGVLTSENELAEDEEMPVMLGLTYDVYGEDERDEAWAWYGENNIIVAPMTDTALGLPDGVTASKKTMSTAKSDYSVWMAENGNDIYLKFADNFGYARGTLADGKVTFENDQYLGVTGSSFGYLVGGVAVFVEDEDYDEGGYTVYRPTESLVFDYKSGDALLKTDGTVIINEGNASFHPLTIYDKAVISDYISVESAPRDPEIVRYNEYDDFDEYGVFVFNFPTTSVDGQEISKADLHYNIFVKGADTPYVFSKNMYELINTDMTDVPYSFTDGGYDFSVNGERHTLVIYEDMGVIGVQSVNSANGKIYKSNIVWSDGSASIKDITADDAAEYMIYDLQGRRVSNPSPGIYIRRHGSDAEKVIIR